MEAIRTGASLRRFPLGFRRPSGDTASTRMPARLAMANGFWDEGHLRYYAPISMSCGLKEEKRRKKIMKGLERNLFALGELGLGLGEKVQVKGQIISEAADLLLAQLTKLRSEAKEMKKKRKQEKAAKKAAAKAAKMNYRDGASSSSSSESSDSDCESVVKMNTLKTTRKSIPDSSSDPITAPLEKIEVCMGGKCKKSGAMELMAEFQRKIDIEGAVVGCKCMGKCRDGPNVRVVNHHGIEDGSFAVRAAMGPLCIGVGLGDVGSIVSDFFGEKNEDLGLLAA